MLGDLYTLGTQLEQRGRAVQATAVYRHLARIDNTYRDVGAALEAPDGCRARQIQGLPAAPRRRSCAAERADRRADGSIGDRTRAAGARGDQGLRAGRHGGGGERQGAPSLPDTAIADGTQRLGRYQLEREIGRGAMGIVYLGRDTAINRLVAIKAIPLASEFSDTELAGSANAVLSRGGNCGPPQSSEHRHDL